MKKRLKAILLIFVVCCYVLMAVGCGASDKNKIRIGTGGKGGNYYNYGTHLNEIIGNDTEYNLDVKETAGSLANLRLLSQGYLDIALVQSDVISKEMSEGHKGFHSVVGLYDEQIQIVVREDSDIKSIEDLKEKVVSLGEEDSGTFKNAKEILEIAGIKLKDVEGKYLSYSDSANALAENEIDAFFCTASAPTTAVTELCGDTQIRVLNFSNDLVKRILASDKGYKECKIEKGTYAGVDEDVITIGVTAVLVASDTLDKDVESTIISILEKNNEELQKISFGIPVEEESESGVFTISLNMYLTLTLAVLVLYLGMFLRKKVKVLETFCIPAPVIGGMIFAIVSCVLYVTGIVEFQFDETLKNICMIIFFTSVGFQANLKVLKKGGAKLIIFLICVITLIVGQNVIAVCVSKILGLDSFVGLCTGSIPMVGGHGTAGAFGNVLEDLGLAGATTLCTAAATFGLVAGSIMGGPIGRGLIIKHDLLKTAASTEDEAILIEDEEKHHRKSSMYAPAAFQIAIAMGIGTIVSELLSMTGMTFPVYIGAMIVAAIIRNVGEYSKKYTVHMGEINDLGGICLSMFLGIAMVTLKLWQLADLALPLFTLLAAQTLFMIIFSRFIIFNVMGRNYDAAVLSAGTCGFGMGATPNAMANMQALTEKFLPSVQAYILVPIVGSMFADFINSLVVTFFINLL